MGRHKYKEKNNFSIPVQSTNQSEGSGEGLFGLISDRVLSKANPASLAKITAEKVLKKGAEKAGRKVGEKVFGKPERSPSQRPTQSPEIEEKPDFKTMKRITEYEPDFENADDLIVAALRKRTAELEAEKKRIAEEKRRKESQKRIAEEKRRKQEKPMTQEINQRLLRLLGIPEE